MANTTSKPTWKAYKIWLKGADFTYFVHGLTPSKARWQVIQRRNDVKGFTLLMCRRFYEFDDRPFTYEGLEELGFYLKNPEMRRTQRPICTCDLCRGAYDRSETK